MKKLKIASVDAETVGLHGKPFSIAVVCYNEEGKEIKQFSIRRELSEEEKTFAETQVFKNEKGEVTFSLPNCIVQSKSILNVADSYKDMLEKFSKFYLTTKEEGFTVLFHMGFIVESFLFRECVRLGFLGQFDCPYLPVELAEILRVTGFHKPDSVDTYCQDKRIIIDCEESSHHPIYDCKVAAAVYYHI